ncbi:SPOR domain-containing protein [Sulfitobacter guttiformis]|uniref:Sporulation related protein n=1 Tax=Sulfitobacter guttiformis TaxID=74349 RepID=A0A420DMP0_9RHOB|nr:SPOR domain-containing protein [Sulfitobacter guttiformis]KIN72855.1 Sporulation related protein [Sulfitobacter guttiformis KCTC 32187]RKE95546.1 sporulation related protein [Sulfitobacter guttiformis]
MADYTQNPQGGFAPHLHPEYAIPRGQAVGKLTNFTGAAVSLALVVGIGIWGYKLLVRDVSGIPVVRAAAGEMRVRPEEPGGTLAEHQGLSVNTVTALGAADEVTEQVRLAPQPIDLIDEDQPMADFEEVSADESSDVTQAPAAEDIASALESGSVDSLVAQLTDGIMPMEATEDESLPVLASVAVPDVQDAPEVLEGDGMSVSLRPSQRPARASINAGTDSGGMVVPAAASASTTELEAASLPVGTRLVQLGAFDTPEIARAQWGQLSARFAPFMEGKQRIVMEAKSGGRTFYRLRAHGFEDIGDARRFCSALVAESVDCIPVVTR